MIGKNLRSFDAPSVRKVVQRVSLGEVVLRDHAAIAGTAVAPEVGVRAGTVARGWLIA